MIPSRKLYYLLLLVAQASPGTFGYTFICSAHKIQKTTLHVLKVVLR